MDYELSEEELDILEAFENGELRSVADAPHEMKAAYQAARGTLDEIEGSQVGFRHDSPPVRSAGSE